MKVLGNHLYYSHIAFTKNMIGIYITMILLNTIYCSIILESFVCILSRKKQLTQGIIVAQTIKAANI